MDTRENTREMEVTAAAREVGQQGQNNTMACIRIGLALVKAHDTHGITYADVEAKMREMGYEPPSPSRASVYMSVYRAWTDTGIAWDELSAFSIDTLYHAGKLIGRPRPTTGGEIITPRGAFNIAKVHSPRQLRQMSRKGGIEAWPYEPEESSEPSDVATVKMPRAALEVWDAFAARLGNVVGGAVSRTKALEFALSIMGDLSDEILDSAWDSAHGDTPDPNEEPFVLVDDEEDEDE